NITIIPVENLFFGQSVTVTGLLSGRDILRALMGKIHENDILLIPDVTLRNGEDIFLDDISFDFIGETLKVKTILIESTFEGLIHALTNIKQQGEGLDPSQKAHNDNLTN
ncbi:MAG: DUF512 domain-containing protein, partial [Nitrospirae bacterium]|nr:DUF512 domain-containing protein [Nitrospirota bacterium]